MSPFFYAPADSPLKTGTLDPDAPRTHLIVIVKAGLGVVLIL
jgi:hypothetical protein